MKELSLHILDVAKNSVKAGATLVGIDINTDREGMMTIRISDNGCGIASSDIGRVGEKFYKANFTRHGSGIGLATCDEIIRLHNGLLRIESKENEGTRVSVALPLSSADNT